MMRFGSVCSGIEAASVAWHPLGWRAAFLAEIEPFPRAVLKHHWPDVPLHGDFTTIRTGEYGAIDLLVGGTPCQSFSVAGLRGGLDDERGNLALKYLRLADRLRPRWLVWENVPGALSSNGGRDFGAILGGMVQLGYGFAYRVLDAQFFGVPQRRRRVFVVGYLGNWRPAVSVLFERHSLQGHPAPRREAGQAAPTIPSRSTAGGGLGTDFDFDGGLIAPPLTSNPYGDHESREGLLVAGTVSSKWAKGTGGPSGDECQNLIAHSLRGESYNAGEDGTGRGTPLVPVHCFDARQSGVLQYGNKTGPLDTHGHTHAIAFDTTQITSKTNRCQPKAGDPCHPLAAGAHAPAVAFQASQSGMRLGGDVHPTLDGNNGSRRHHGAMIGSAVRRLLPVECEKLQRFPPGYTAIPWRGRPAEECPDGPRYRCLGNSMAVPVMSWLGQRIEQVEKLCTSARDAA
jgi:DNA (cytosine-5)-methyltransferase 1